jgi:lipoyl(octanoyl) transferase
MAPRTTAILFEALRPVPFPRGWAWQRRLQRRLLVDPDGPEALLLLQHQPCYTLGRGASLEHLHFDPAESPLPLYRIDRGGEVTHHAPGQLVLYPVLDLRRHGGDLHLYLRALEQVVIDLLAELGLDAARQSGRTGVWLEGRKLAAIGVGARRWISQHGLALNVEASLAGFASITPCGLRDLPVGRLSDWRPELRAVDLAPRLLDHAARVFALQLRPPRAAERLPGLSSWCVGSAAGRAEGGNHGPTLPPDP